MLQDAEVGVHAGEEGGPFALVGLVVFRDGVVAVVCHEMVEALRVEVGDPSTELNHQFLPKRLRHLREGLEPCAS